MRPLRACEAADEEGRKRDHHQTVAVSDQSAMSNFPRATLSHMVSVPLDGINSLCWPHVTLLHPPNSTPTSSPHYYTSYQPVTMGARRRKATMSLNDKIDILDRNAVGDFPAKQVFKIVSVILALVRVSAVVSLCSLWTLDLDDYPIG